MGCNMLLTCISNLQCSPLKQDKIIFHFPVNGVWRILKSIKSYSYKPAFVTQYVIYMNVSEGKISIRLQHVSLSEICFIFSFGFC